MVRALSEIQSMKSEKKRSLRVLLLGSQLNYNLEHYVKMALERLGCTVEFVGYHRFLGRLAVPIRVIITRSKAARPILEAIVLRKFNDIAKLTGNNFRPDLVLVIKGEAVLPKTVRWLSDSLGAITALWYPDDPRYFESFSKVIAPFYQYVFTSSQRSVSKYEDLAIENVEYLPFGCEPSVHRPLKISDGEPRTFACDVCFVGTFSRRRARIVRALERSGLKVKVWGPFWTYFRRGPNTQGPVYGPEMAKVFNSSKVVLNIHDERDLDYKPNMRVFEATGCGSLVLTDSAFGLEHFFSPGKEVLCYENETDLLEFAHRYVNSPWVGEAIAAAGHARAYRDHTYDRRLETLVETIF